MKRGSPVPYGDRTFTASPGENPLAEALYLVSRSNAAHTPLVNGVRAVLINADDAQTDAQIKAAAGTALSNVATGTDVDSSVRESYFDTVTKVSDLSAGPLKDNLDAYVFTPGGPVKTEGA